MTKSIPNYGIWVCQPTHFRAQTARQDPHSPHVYLYFKDHTPSTPTHGEKEAAINVKSLDTDTRLVFWADRDFAHPVTEELEKLELGFEPIRSSHHRGCSNGHGLNWEDHEYEHDRGSHRHSRSSRPSPLQGLDYIRTKGLLDLQAGRVLPHDIPGPNNDILDDLEPILQNAINRHATAYIFGSSFGSGIHDIHMNQGSLPGFDNGVYEDGAVLFRFEDDGHWEALFMAFASQRIPTDDRTGVPVEGSRALADILGQ